MSDEGAAAADGCSARTTASPRPARERDAPRPARWVEAGLVLGGGRRCAVCGVRPVAERTNRGGAERERGVQCNLWFVTATQRSRVLVLLFVLFYFIFLGLGQGFSLSFFWGAPGLQPLCFW